jgi:Na+/H+-dicarboxylate symporter
VIFVALLFGIAIVLLGEKETAAFMNVVNSLDKIILQIVELIMEFASVAVLASSSVAKEINVASRASFFMKTP